MTMISYLPMDIVMEIISRVPLISMRAVRLTCKKWNTLSKSESFMKMHIGKSAREGETRMVMMMDKCVHLVSVFYNDPPSTEILGKLKEQVEISQVFHSEGLLVCLLTEYVTKVMVWNPYLGQIRWIDSKYSRRPHGWDRLSYALGYDNTKSRRNHRFLRVIDEYHFIFESQSRRVWYEIYDFDSGLWTSFDVNPHWRILLGPYGVSVKGNTYFRAMKRHSEGELDDHIICFDFARERFGPLVRLPFSAGYLSLFCVREEKLAVLDQHKERNCHKIDIWISTKIEAGKVSWSKFLTVDTEPIFSITRWSFFIDEDNKVAIGLDPYAKTFNIIGEGGYFRKLKIGGHDNMCSSQRCSYVPSSVQINKAT